MNQPLTQPLLGETKLQERLHGMASPSTFYLFTPSFACLGKIIGQYGSEKPWKGLETFPFLFHPLLLVSIEL